MKTLPTLLLTLILTANLSAQNSVNSMSDYYTNPVVEEGKRNIILQNRCGNRLTLLMFENKMELEFIYKPNAYRRKDYRARNFSNRDNFTKLFSSFSYPQIEVADINEFNYDPFYTMLHHSKKHGSENDLHFLNLADENAFVLSAKAPLMMVIKPHVAFEESNGLIYEKFHDRGEEIISFVKFINFEQNRFRKMADGSVVIQIIENEPIIVGGEENMYQVNRVLNKYQGKDLNELIVDNEKTLKPKMSKGQMSFDNPDFQKVIDLNHRIVYSGMDEGGACFGALNRIYYLIWIRDGSMTTSLMARSGNPDLVKTFAPFLLNNPSYTKKDGELKPEFLQILGSRWTKSEDDGIFYAMLSLYTYFQTTGNDDLLHTGEFEILMQTLDRFLDKTWDEEKKMIVSDTWGETPLMSDPYFGYDAVNGNYEVNDNHIFHGKEVLASASFYNNVNTWNILKMAEVLLEQKPELKSEYLPKILGIEKVLKESLTTNFVNKELGVFYQGNVTYKDGTDEWYPVDDNPWEFSWAQTLGPYFPDLEMSVKTTKYIKDSWGDSDRGYGYSPWNCLANKLYEFGMTSTEYEKMLSVQIKEALMLTKKYPMPGALSEYKGHVESWRALPFSAGTFFFSLSAHCLQSLPMGIAVRASNKMDTVKNFQYRLSKFQYTANGDGDKVETFRLNDNEIKYTLQLPVSVMLPGNNVIEVKRGQANEEFRLYSSTASLQKIDQRDNTLTYHFNNPIESEFLFENYDKIKDIKIYDITGSEIKFEKKKILDTGLTQITSDFIGDFNVVVKL